MFDQKNLKIPTEKSLLIVSGIYPPDIGGPAIFASNFRDWEIAKSKTVNLVTLTDGPTSKESFTSGIIHKISRKNPFFLRSLKSIWSIYNLSRNCGSILVVGGFLEAYFATFFSRKKRIVKVPGDIVWERARNSGLTTLDILSFQNSALKVKYKIFRWLFSVSLRSADTVIAPSKFLHTLCLNWGVDPKKIKLIYNGISVEAFTPANGAVRDIQVLTVCRLTAWKGLEDLILACKKSDLALTIVGTGPLKSKLQNFAKREDVNVMFMGDRTNSELREIYRRSRVFVLNSSYEGLPHSLLEAMASGCIVVANAGTGSAEVIEHEVNGFLSEYDNENKLHKILIDTKSNSDCHERIRASARKTVISRFNQEITFSKINGIIEC